MENASKALLIAGGVLIAMLVATFGVYFSRTFSQETSKIYRQLEDTDRTEFNQKFLNFDNEKNLNIQDVVTIINLAKNSNQANGLTDDMSPTDLSTDTSLYVTVNFDPSFDDEESLLKDDDGTKYLPENAEKFTNDILINILNSEGAKNTLYSCEVETNPNTGYVNYIKIEP